MRALLILLFIPLLAFAQAGGPPFIPVNMMKVSETPVSNTVNAVGALIAEDSVVLRPEIDGRIDKLLFKEGQPVKKGAVLVVLDSAERAPAWPRPGRPQAGGKPLQAQRGTGRTEFHFPAGARRSARQPRHPACTPASRNRSALDKTVIRAPFDAVAGLRQVSPGAYVNKGDDIVRLDALGNLKLEVPVPETYLSLVRIGLPITLTVDALPGTNLQRQGARHRPGGRSGQPQRAGARAHRQPGGNLKPGMFARATADLGGKTHAILLPEQVIVPKPDGSYVFLAVDGKAELRKVVLGKRDPGRVEIVSGVKVGDTVMLDGQIKLRPGVPVVTLEQAAQMMKKMQAGKPR